MFGNDEKLSRVFSQSASVMHNELWHFFTIKVTSHIKHCEEPLSILHLRHRRNIKTFRFLYKFNNSLYNVKIEYLNTFNA